MSDDTILRLFWRVVKFVVVGAVVVTAFATAYNGWWIPAAGVIVALVIWQGLKRLWAWSYGNAVSEEYWRRVDSGEIQLRK